MAHAVRRDDGDLLICVRAHGCTAIAPTIATVATIAAARQQFIKSTQLN